MYATSECICNFGMCSVKSPQPAQCCMIQPTLTFTKPLRCYWSSTSFKKQGNVSQPRPRSQWLPIRDLRWEEIMKSGKGGGVRRSGRDGEGEGERGDCQALTRRHPPPTHTHRSSPTTHALFPTYAAHTSRHLLFWRPPAPWTRSWRTGKMLSCFLLLALSLVALTGKTKKKKKRKKFFFIFTEPSVWQVTASQHQEQKWVAQRIRNSAWWWQKLV